MPHRLKQNFMTINEDNYGEVLYMNVRQSPSRLHQLIYAPYYYHYIS